MAETEKYKLDQGDLTLEKVIQKIHDIGNDEYEGKLYDNILPIFNSLTTREKRVYLRGLVNICLIIESSVSRNTKAAVEATNKVHDEIGDIEDFNTRENIMLKTWLMKMITSVSLMALMGLLCFLFFFDGDKAGMVSGLKSAIELVKLLFGGD